MPLETERLLLRRLSDADADSLAQLDADPEVMRYLTGGHSIESESLPRNTGFDAGLGFWAVIEKASGAFIGWCGLEPLASGVAKLGYRLRRSAWGNGYATEAARALVEEAFAGGVKRVIATTYEENVASVRVMEKLGMRLARRFRMTPEDLGGHTPWEGDDLEYVMEPS